jgi:hypothetical protein
MSDPVTMFTAIKWTDQDKRFAQSEGWDVFDVDSTGVLEIQSFVEKTPFENDSVARAFVARRAAEGSSLHLKALCVLAGVIVDDQLHHCCDTKDVAADIETAQGLYNVNGSVSDKWAVSLVSQLTILRSTI